MSKRLLLFDFDETYFKHNTNEEDLSHLREMEKLLEKLTNNNEVITAVLNRGTAFFKVSWIKWIKLI